MSRGGGEEGDPGVGGAHREGSDRNGVTGESLWKRWVQEAEREHRLSISPPGRDEPPEPELPVPQRISSLGSKPRHTPERMECLEMRSRTEQASVNGLGLQLTRGTPHVVQRVTRLVDAEGRTATNAVAEGDALMGIDGCPVDASSVEVIEQLLSGVPHSNVRLTIRSEKTSAHYDVVVRRHLPIRTWDHIIRWYELKSGLEGATLRCSADIVGVLEEARALVCDATGNTRDLLKFDQHAQTTLGFRLQHAAGKGKRSDWVVQHVITGSAVHMDGDVLAGDELLMVDGVSVAEADEGTLVEALRSSDIVGSKARLQILRQGRTFEVLANRSSVAFVREVERLCFLLEEHAQMIQEQAGQSALIHSAQDVMDHVLGMERHRVVKERQLTERLSSVCENVRERITRAQSMLRAPRAWDEDGGKSIRQPQWPDHSGQKISIQDWERRMEVLKELVQVMKGPPSVSPNSLAQAILCSGLHAHDVVEILQVIGSGPRRSVQDLCDALGPGERGGGASFEGMLSQERGARALAETENSQLRSECVQLQTENTQLRSRIEMLEKQLTQGQANDDMLKQHAARMQREVEELTERVCPRPEDHLRPPLLPLSAQQGTSRSQSPVQASSQIQTRSASPARPASPIRPRAPSNAHIGPGIPHFVPNGGVFNTTALVNIFADAPGAVIFYSTNGSKPSVTHYEGQGPQPLSVYLSKTCTLKAISVVGGVAGEVVSSDFVVDLGDRHHYQHVVHVSSHRTERHRSPPDPPQPMEAPNVPAGVGMLLERSEKSHHVRVKHIMPGGAADLQGSIRLGDRLLSVDDASVDTLPFPQLLEAIKGPPGSRIRLCLIRDGVSPSPSPSSSTRTSPPRPYTVNLQRQQVQGVGVLGTYASPTLSHPTNFIPTPTSTKSISTLASMPASVMPSPYDVQQTINSPSALFGHQGGVSPVRHSSNASGARRELAGGFGAATGQGGHGYNLYM